MLVIKILAAIAHDAIIRRQIVLAGDYPDTDDKALLAFQVENTNMMPAYC